MELLNSWGPRVLLFVVSMTFLFSVIRFFSLNEDTQMAEEQWFLIVIQVCVVPLFWISLYNNGAPVAAGTNWFCGGALALTVLSALTKRATMRKIYRLSGAKTKSTITMSRRR